MTTVIKLEGPAQVLTYLGIESDTVSSIIRLPEDKLKQTKTLTAQWLNRKKMHQISSTFTNRDALSFACKVVKPGRMFLRRLIDLSTTVSSLHHHIDISSSLCEDLKMWHHFLETWNGSSYIPLPPISYDSLNLYTDASFKGLGGFLQGYCSRIECE